MMERGSYTGDFHPIRSRPCLAYTKELTGHDKAVPVIWGAGDKEMKVIIIGIFIFAVFAMRITRYFAL
jgi:hypothetical protein